MFDDLNEENFMMYAMKSYTSPHCVMSEFEGDIKRTKYLKRLFRRYKVTKTLKERLILNHIILLNNVFGPEVTSRILFYRPLFLYFILFNGKNIKTSEIPVDMNIAEILRKI